MQCNKHRNTHKLGSKSIILEGLKLGNEITLSALYEQ